MKRLQLLILFIGGLFISGCQPVVRIIYGVKNPDFYRVSEIMKFQTEIGLEETPYFGFTAENWISVKDRGYPDLYVFDKKGRFIDFHDTLKPNCNGPAEQFLTELDSERTYNYSSKYTLDSFLALLEDTACNRARLIKLDSTNFYVFLTYASFMGKLVHRQKTLVWRDALVGNNKIKYQLYYLSEDLKSCWSDEQKKLFEEKGK